MEEIHLDNVLRLLTDRVMQLRLPEPVSTPNNLEQDLASHLFSIMKQASENTWSIEEYRTLGADLDFKEIRNQDQVLGGGDPEVIHDSSAASSELDEPLEKVDEKPIPFELKKRIIEHWPYKQGHSRSKKKNRPVEQMQKDLAKDLRPFKYILTEQRLISIRKEIQAKHEGKRDKRMKHDMIAEATLKKFNDAVRKGAQIHDITLRSMAMESLHELGYDQFDFEASQTWVTRFKVKFNITSRKITHFVSRKTFINEETIKENARAFVSNTNLELDQLGFDSDQLLNADQMGFTYEIHGKRTLAIKGTKNIDCVVGSVNATTHSYTVMPLIDASGTLHKPLYVVLRERKTLSDTVWNNMYKFENLLISQSTSGKMGNELAIEWFDNCILNVVPKERFALLVDSWGCFKVDRMQAQADKHESQKDPSIFKIPEHCTKYIQPLDVYFNGPYKSFFKHIEGEIIRLDINLHCNQRDRVLKLQDIVFNQFLSPRYRDLIRYAWKASGFKIHSEEIPVGPSINPKIYSFKNVKKSKCQTCQLFARIRCGWCSHYFCYNHFLNEHGHTCQTFNS